jgi:DNA-binding PucR family transcriptional regulator
MPTSDALFALGQPEDLSEPREDTTSLRERLSNLRALLVVSMLMTEQSDEAQILRLAASSSRSLGQWHMEGFLFTDGTWRPGGTDRAGQLPYGLRSQVTQLGAAGGPVNLPGRAWGWAYPLRSVAGLLGHAVACADQPPSVDERFIIQAVAQQTGVAVSNARLHQAERAATAELASTNSALQETVASLRRSMQIHQRLTAVAVSGEGQQGVADAVHDLTGMPVAIEDRYGNLRAWAGPGQPDPYPKEPLARREQLLRRLTREGRPVRDGGRLVLLASPRPDVIGMLALIDIDHRADGADLIALEHGATVLSMELARLRGLADAELRLRRDLVQDLLAGTDDESAYLRADALNYDLRRPHRVVVVERCGRTTDDQSLVHAAGRAARELQLRPLLDTRSGAVVMVTARKVDWEQLRQVIQRELGTGRCRLGVGTERSRPAELPRSLREAQIALRLQTALHKAGSDQACEYERLGVFRMLATLPDPDDVEGFVREWLGSLIDYDTRRSAELVETLTQYLELGGSYDATAKAMSVHRSTLKYRLQRIREISGHDLGDPDTHFNLHLATRAWTTLCALQ